MIALFGTITKDYLQSFNGPSYVAAVSISGTCLDVLGSLYLAYDLLGGQHGPCGCLRER